MSEASLHQLVVTWLKYHHPAIIFRTDFSAGVKMTIGQAVKHKSLQHSRAFPDLQILKPNRGYHGLFLELKKTGTRISKRDGSYSSDHLLEQAAMLAKLKSLGYCASFAVGFDEAVEIINDYLK